MISDESLRDHGKWQQCCSESENGVMAVSVNFGSSFSAARETFRCENVPAFGYPGPNKDSTSQALNPKLKIRTLHPEGYMKVFQTGLSGASDYVVV